MSYYLHVLRSFIVALLLVLQVKAYWNVAVVYNEVEKGFTEHLVFSLFAPCVCN